ncbi:MAG: hypothetical protein ACFFDT_15860 [Candidatus Hodarchaeota archaeon]
MTVLRDLKSILTLDGQGLHEISLSDSSTIRAIIVITILAILETIFGLYYTLLNSENLINKLIINGTISTFSIFELVFIDLYTFFYNEQLHIEITISLIVSSFLMFYIFTILFTYILTVFINKLGGNIMPINCFRIIGLSLVFEVILLILSELIRLNTSGTPIPQDISISLIFMSLIFQFLVIFFGIITVSELPWWKVGISIVIAYIIAVILGFIAAGVIIRGIINDLFNFPY